MQIKQTEIKFITVTTHLDLHFRVLRSLQECPAVFRQLGYLTLHY